MKQLGNQIGDSKLLTLKLNEGKKKYENGLIITFRKTLFNICHENL